MAGYIRRVPTDADSGLMAWFWDGDGVAKNRDRLVAVAFGDRPFVSAGGSRWEKCEVATDVPIPNGYRQCSADEARELSGARRWVPDQHEWLPMGTIAPGRPEYFIVPIEPPKDSRVLFVEGDSGVGEGYRRLKPDEPVLYMDHSRLIGDVSWFVLDGRCVNPIQNPGQEYRRKVEPPKYRPFASREEWWPHRDRWARLGEFVDQLPWMGDRYAADKLSSGAVFLNDDGTDAEPYGVLVMEDE